MFVPQKLSFYRQSASATGLNPLCFQTSCHCYIIVTNSFVEVFLVKLLWKFPVIEIHYLTGNIEQRHQNYDLNWSSPEIQLLFFLIYNMQIMIQNLILWKLKRWIACIFCKSREYLTFWMDLRFSTNVIFPTFQLSASMCYLPGTLSEVISIGLGSPVSYLYHTTKGFIQENSVKL